MVKWMRWHCPPDTGYEIRTLAFWGRARYFSVTEAPHNINFLRWAGKKHFVSMNIEILLKMYISWKYVDFSMYLAGYCRSVWGSISMTQQKYNPLSNRYQISESKNNCFWLPLEIAKYRDISERMIWWALPRNDACVKKLSVVVK